MNQKVKEFLDKAREREIKKRNEYLIKLGLYEKEFAPITRTGWGSITDSDGNSKTLKFNLNSENVKVGDAVKVPYDNKKWDVVVEKIEVDNQHTTPAEYQYFEYDAELKTSRGYKKVPIEVTDDEYNQILMSVGKPSGSSYNVIATIMTVIAIIVFIGGFIGGCVMIEEFVIALIVWASSFTGGMMFLGFAEIINLLTAIKNK